MGAWKGSREMAYQRNYPPMYPEEYLWRERHSTNEPTAFINILSHIAGIYMERYRKATLTLNCSYIFYINIFSSLYKLKYFSDWLVWIWRSGLTLLLDFSNWSVVLYL